jgi:hypothetical protein
MVGVKAGDVVSTDHSAIVAGQIVFSGGNLITQIGMQQILPSNARILIDKDEGTEWLMRMELPRRPGWTDGLFSKLLLDRC